MAEYKGFRADRLRKAMKENGATVEDIAGAEDEEETLLNDLYFQRFYELVDGIGFPSISELYKICKYVNVSADYLLGLSDDMY